MSTAQEIMHHGDCLDLMPTIDRNSVDLLICDPPYGYKVNRWDNSIDEKMFWKALSPGLKKSYVAVFFCDFRLGAKLIASNKKQFKYDLVWKKVGRLSGHLNANRAPMREHENLAVFAGPKNTYNPQMTKGKPHNRHLGKCRDYSGENFGSYIKSAKPNVGTRYPTSILSESRVNGGQIHPTQKPVALVEWIIKTYTNDGDTIIDPCAGSGVTAIAAMNVGNRKVICIEKDAAYFEVMSKRVAEHKERLKQLSAPP